VPQKRKQFNGEGEIIPGQQVVRAIVAVGDRPERIVREIAQPSSADGHEKPMKKQSRQTRCFWRYFDYRSTCHGAVKNESLSEPRPLALHIGAEGIEMRPEVLVLKEVPGRQASMKTRRGEHGERILEIGQDIPESRISKIATQIVATHVINGSGWTDRSGNTHPEPYGTPPERELRTRQAQ
jgi:hypothetical protein